MQSDPIDYIFKYILIGNGNCGKTSLLYRFINGKSYENPSQTIGVEFSTKNMDVCSKRIKLQLWDTAGQERYRSVAKAYYRGSMGAIILYDITNIESYSAVERWVKDAREFAKPDIQIIVVGNKKDLFDHRVIPTGEAQKYCTSIGVSFVETSAVSGENVEWVMQLLSQKVLDRIERGLLDTESLRPRIRVVNKKQVEESQKQQCYC